MSFSNVDNRKQIQRKKQNFINIMPSYLLAHTQIGKKRNKVEEKRLAHFLFSTFLFWYDVSKMSEKSYE